MWDLALDLATGDFMFGPSRDLLVATGPELVNQRILSRCKIPRGTFPYDDDGNLGSRLHTISRQPNAQQTAQLVPLVHEALEGMDDIAIGEITPTITEDGLLVNVSWSPVQEPEDIGIAPDPELPEFDVDVIVSD